MPLAMLTRAIRVKMLPLARRKMKAMRNPNFMDRVIRIGGGLLLIGLGVGRRGGLTGKVLSILGGTLLFEGIVSYSPVNDWFDFSRRGNGLV